MTDDFLFHAKATPSTTPAEFNLTGQPDADGWITVGYTHKGWILSVDDDRIVCGTPLDMWWAPLGTDVPEQWPPGEPWQALSAPAPDERGRRAS